MNQLIERSSSLVLLLVACWAAACDQPVTTAGGCDGPVSAIHDLQGIGPSSPRTGETVTVRGVLVGDFLAENELQGLFLQQAEADDDPRTSEGIFVHEGDK